MTSSDHRDSRPWQDGDAYPRRSRFARIGLGAVILVLLLAGGYLVLASSIASHRQVYIVNGTDKTYDVIINGTTITLPPDVAVPHRVAEGNVTIQRLGPAGPGDVQTVRIETPLLTRVFGRHTFVVNPDECAVLAWEQAGYYDMADRGGYDEHYEERFYAGEPLHHFTGVEYPFEEFPDFIDSSRLGVDDRHRVVLADDLSADEAFYLIADDHSPQRAIEHLRKVLANDPDSMEHLHVLSEQLDARAFVEFLTPHCRQRPLLVECHRFYQTTILHVEPDRDLEAEYRAILDEDPDDPAGIYLLARVIDDPEAAEAMTRRAADHPQGHIHAQHAMVLAYQSTARFDQALEASRVLRRRDPEEEHFLYHELETLLALQRFDEALALRREMCDPEYLSGWCAVLEMAIYTMEQPEAVEGVRTAYLRSLRQQTDDDATMAAWRRYLVAMERYLSGDATGCGEALADSEDPYDRFLAMASLGRVSELESILAEMGWEDTDDYLIAAACALHHGDTAAADVWLARAAEELVDHGPTGRVIAAWLGDERRGEPAPDADLVLRFCTHTSTKRLVLTVLGQLDAAHASRYFAQARALNFDPRFPGVLIRQIVGD